MNTFEFEAQKAALARAILNTNSPEIIGELTRIFQAAVEREAPCQYSLDEVKARLRNTQADAIAGRGLSEEEADKLMDAMI